MNILVACEESQEVCKAFLAKGHNVYSCDIQMCSGGVPGRHIMHNVLDIIKRKHTFLGYGHLFFTCDNKLHFVKKWDMLIAFPPCTYFSRVNFFNYYRHGIFNEKRFADSKSYVSFFLSLYNANIKYICLENPLPISLFRNILPPFSMKLQPYEFGEPYSKLTCLWLKNLPPLVPTLFVSNYSSYVVINGNRIDGKFNAKLCSKYRSKTFHGIALAMAEQWGNL